MAPKNKVTGALSVATDKRNNLKMPRLVFFICIKQGGHNNSNNTNNDTNNINNNNDNDNNNNNNHNNNIDNNSNKEKLVWQRCFFLKHKI